MYDAIIPTKMESFEDEGKLFLYYEGILYTAVGKYKIIFPKIDMTIDELNLTESLSFSYNYQPLLNFAEKAINRPFKIKSYDTKKHFEFRPQWFSPEHSNKYSTHREIYNKDGSATFLNNEEIFFTIEPIK